MQRIKMVLHTRVVRWGFPLFLVVILGACATWKQAPRQLGIAGWSVEIPEGWMRFSTTGCEMLSKDGPYLQYILIQARSLEQPFRFTHRKMDSHMLPHEAAQVIIANLSSDPQIENFHLIRNEPAAMDHAQGFKLEYTYIDSQGVDVRAIHYGAIYKRLFLQLRYTAADRHYFSKDMAEFEQIRSSLHLESAS